jgi:mitotic spindle assembly checkpoint protein MAD2B
MTNPPPSAGTLNNILGTHRALVNTLASFLTVSIHHILYLRHIYPPVSFLSTRAYNYPVRQSRHPAVCAWINDAIAAVKGQLEKNTVERVAVCIYECDANRVLERWTFDLRCFPVVEKRERDVPFDDVATSTDDPTLCRKINIADLEAQFRAMLSRITTSAGRLKPLPSGNNAPECSFTVTIEVKDDADRPVGRLEKEERKWIAAEPDVFEDFAPNTGSGPDEDQTGSSKSSEKQSGKTVPVRRLEVGELRMEVWIEESKAKLEYENSVPSAQSTSLSQQPVASFNPETGYELEPADVNRKPQPAADYRR